MKILQSRSFERKVRKFARREKSKLDQEIRKVIDNPYIGSEKLYEEWDRKGEERLW